MLYYSQLIELYNVIKFKGENMARPKKNENEKFQRVQIYLPKNTIRKLELTDFIRESNFSKSLRDYINNQIEKDNSDESK